MKKLAYLMAGLGLMLSQLDSAPAMAKITISVVPAHYVTSVGGKVTVDIVASGLSTGGAGGGQEVISAYDLLLGFDPTKLSWESTTFGDSLGPNSSDPPNENTYSVERNSAFLAGVNYSGSFNTAVEFNELSVLCAFSDGDISGCTYQPLQYPYLSSIQGDSVKLVTIAFNVLPGFQPNQATPLGLIDDRYLNPQPPGGLFDVKGSVAGVGLSGIILVDGQASIPEPSTLMLLLSAGLVSLGCSAARRRQ